MKDGRGKTLPIGPVPPEVLQSREAVKAAEARAKAEARAQAERMGSEEAKGAGAKGADRRARGGERPATADGPVAERAPKADASQPEAAPPSPARQPGAEPRGKEEPQWDELYNEFLDAESRRAERIKRQAEEQEALREFESWSTRTVERLMQDVKRIAEGRSREFLERTGHTLEVQYPSGPAISGPNGDPEIRFLRLSLGSARVHVYSSHARGGTTHIHLLPSRGDSLQKNHRLVSEPGAFLVRTSDESYDLRFLRGDPAGKTGSPMSLDMLMFKAFRLLVKLAEDDEEEPARPQR